MNHLAVLLTNSTVNVTNLDKPRELVIDFSELLIRLCSHLLLFISSNGNQVRDTLERNTNHAKDSNDDSRIRRTSGKGRTRKKYDMTNRDKRDCISEKL